MPSSTNISMEKSGQPQPQPLQCPRCSSSNTKFCYYNNYSLAQPRHFCKACKRYWTRGGTLRNVPVGGGCRKNKRMMKRQVVAAAAAATSATTSFNFTGGSDGISSSAFSVTTNSNIAGSSDLDLSQSSDPGSNNPSFYPNPREIKFPFSMFSSIRVSSELGFLSGIEAGDEFQQANYEDGVNPIQNFAIPNLNSGSIPSSAAVSMNPVPAFRPPTFPSSTMASLLASTFQQHNFLSGDNFRHVQHGRSFRNLIPSDDVEIMQPGKQVESTIEEINTSPHVWNTSGEWFDPSDLGSSIPSLI